MTAPKGQTLTGKLTAAFYPSRRNALCIMSGYKVISYEVVISSIDYFNTQEF